MRKPKLIVSKCLNFEKCRYDGQGYNNKVVMSLKEHTDLQVVCPEVEIGLSTPREPIRIEKHKEKEEYKLVQHNTNYDFTEKMNNFTSNFISNINDVDGFILKSRSPSCGIKDVKIYYEGNKCSINNGGSGFFSQGIIDTYKNLPIENEGRLKNYSIRDNFLTKIFTINRLKDSDDIIKFHNTNELLLKSYNEEKLSEISKIILETDEKEAINLYKEGVYEILASKRNKEAKTDIVKNMFNIYKNQLCSEEIEVFKKLVNSYENEKVPFSSLALAIRMYAARFKDNNILNQTFFNPYPEELINISDSGKGRDL
ncbi:MAG: YbgA family protein [Peptostreptococcaceae bacterium]